MNNMNFRPYLMVYLLLSLLQFVTITRSQNDQTLFEKIQEENHDHFDQTLSSKPIRVTLNYEILDRAKEEEKKAIISIMNAAINILPKLLKVYPTNENNKPQFSTCEIPLFLADKEKGIGIENSDLHIYIQLFNNPQSNLRAISHICSMYSNEKGVRPNFIAVWFNLGRLEKNFKKTNAFQIQIQVALHEIIHGLGFGIPTDEMIRYYYEKSENQKFVLEDYLRKYNFDYQMIRGTSTQVIKSKHVLSTAKKHFGCYNLNDDNLLGMQLENYGEAKGSKDGHWEETILKGEIMESANYNALTIFSVFTTSYLKDTGYWAGVNENLASPIYWGKNKGCDFLLNACQATPRFEEFKEDLEQGCTFQNDGFGFATNNGLYDSCFIINPFGNNNCSDDASEQENNQDDLENGLNHFGINSKCFESDISKDREKNRSNQFWNSRCFQYECSDSNDSIKITTSKLPSFTVTCDSGEERTKKQVMSTDGNYLGDLTCPSNYERFCDNSTICENHCSSNGICLRGICHCSPGYAGRGCSLSCEKPTKYSNKDECVESCPANLIANPDNTCKEKCPKGYYASVTDDTRVCSPCDFSCSECSGPSENECSACTYLLFLEENLCVEKCSENRIGFNGTCVYSCPAGTYEIENTCISCSPGCTKCSNGSSCTECGTQNKFTLVNGKCCQSPCTDCHVTDPRLCTACEGDLIFNMGSCVEECPFNKRLSTNRTCERCLEECKTCFTLDICEKCQIGYTLSEYQMCTKSKQVP